MRCADCKHWGVVATFTLPDGSVHDLGKPIFMMDGDIRQCLKLEETLDQDGEPCTGGAHLGTPHDFGCVLFEPGREPDPEAF